jgi:hypothetical protein
VHHHRLFARPHFLFPSFFTMNPTSTNTPSTAEQIDLVLESIKKNDPVAASAIEAMEILFQALSPRNIGPREVMCQCGGIAVFDYTEKQFTCFDCDRVWSS